jgi:hypothetical protein
MRPLEIALLFPLLAGVLMSGPSESSETRLHLVVPKILSEQAARRLAGESDAPPPILILEGVQVVMNRGLTIDVLGEPKRGSSRTGPLLAVAGVVAQEPPESPNSTVHKINITVPLNDKAAELLAKQSQVTLTLKVEGEGKIKLDRAYFDTTESH